MIAAPYFTVDLFELKEPHVFFHLRIVQGKNSVQILVAVEGCGVVEAQGLRSGYAGQRRRGRHSRGCAGLSQCVRNGQSSF